MFTLLIFLFSFVSYATEAVDLIPEIQRTWACHRAYARTGDSHYEVFERERLLLAQSPHAPFFPETDPEKQKQWTMTLLILDQDSVYSATIPATSARESFQLVLGSGRAFCAKMIKGFWSVDRIEEFKPSPPADCGNRPVMTAQKHIGPEGVTYLQTLQLRLQRSLNSRLRSGWEIEASDAQKMQQACSGISLPEMDATLRQLSLPVGPGSEPRVEPTRSGPGAR